MKNATVSIIMPVFNRTDLLRRVSLPSAVAVHPFEIIVVDDGSDDALGVRKVVESFQFPISLIRQDNKGLAAARNVGIRAARGEWVICFDSDDTLLPSGWDSVQPFLNQNYDIVVGGTLRVNLATGVMSGIGPSTPSSVFLKRSIFAKYGYYNESNDLIGLEDFDHKFEMDFREERGEIKVYRFQRPICIYHSHDSQITNIKNSERLRHNIPFFINKWRSKSNDFGNLYRNLGVYEIIGGNVAAGRKYLQKSFFEWRSISSGILYLLSFFGKKIFQKLVYFIMKYGKSAFYKIDEFKFLLRGNNIFSIRREARRIRASYPS
jgi:glycosyltransferase involved in cell wall biosynthesis